MPQGIGDDSEFITLVVLMAEAYRVEYLTMLAMVEAVLSE